MNTQAHIEVTCVVVASRRNLKGGFCNRVRLVGSLGPSHNVCLEYCLKWREEVWASITPPSGQVETRSSTVTEQNRCQLFSHGPRLFFPRVTPHSRGLNATIFLLGDNCNSRWLLGAWAVHTCVSGQLAPALSRGGCSWSLQGPRCGALMLGLQTG